MSKYYYPSCKEKDCGGILKITINDNFSLDYECKKNENHKRNKIYFKTFENFYLKENNISICSKCKKNVPSNYVFKCKKCDNIYCNSCYIFDNHIQEKIENLNQVSSCPLHKMYLTHYCEDCNLNLCIFCLKNDEKDNKHQYHNIENILEYMPSLTKINDLIIKIKQKEEYYNNLINKINNWKRRIIFKVEELKQNLKDEIDFLKKFVTNFNQYFVNYSYFSNFYYLEEYINDINNEYLEKFNNSYNLKAETNSLIDLFCSNEKDNIEIIEKKKLNSIDILINDEMIIKKFNNRNIFINYNDIIALSYYNNEKKKLFVNISLNEKIIDKIYSVSFSINKDQIYACLLNKKIVLIFNIYEGTIVKSNQKIVDQPKKSNTHFNKCIQINDTYIATADNSFIKIWEPKIFGKNTKNYSNVKVFEIYESTSDLLLIENDFFISYQPVNQTITFINNHTFFSYNEDKIIPNIDCSNTENCLFL